MPDEFWLGYKRAVDAYATGGLTAASEVISDHPNQMAILDLIRGDDADEAHSIPDPSQNKGKIAFESVHWPLYVDILRSRNRTSKEIQTVDSTSDRIVDYLFDTQALGAQSRYGLVIGHVQSGKTANMIGVIAKAADLGYNFVIVLAGLYNDLRRQTQGRLMSDLIKPVRKRTSLDWSLMTTSTKDFVDEEFPAHSTHIISIIKKNVSPLEKMLNAIDRMDPERKSKINALIIDDEADHASINTLSGVKEVFKPDDHDSAEVSDANAINRNLRLILQELPRFCYIGYTATPFANVFTNPMDDGLGLGPTLYPRDFIVALPTSSAYSGLKDLFEGRDGLSTAVRIVPEEEADQMRELVASDLPTMEIPSSFENALMDHFLSGAEKRATLGILPHHTMMVHVRHLKVSMKPIVNRVKTIAKDWCLLFADTRNERAVELLHQFERRWRAEFASDSPHHWNTIRENLGFMSQRIPDVMEINMDSDDQLVYPELVPQHYIAIGGNRLSRGLTLEGLSVSYFVRNTDKYDTLLQMGRWFGYHGDFERLVRVHTTEQLCSSFLAIAEAERELRDDISRYEASGHSPLDYGIRVLRHIGLRPTSPNKMRDVDLILDQISVGNRTFFTRELPLDSLPDLETNLKEANILVDSLIEQYGDPIGASSGLMWEGVDSQTILDFISSLKLVSTGRLFPRDHIRDFVSRSLSDANWSVVLPGSSTGTMRVPFDSGEASQLNWKLPTRSRFSGSNTIGTLPGSWDYVLDLPEPNANFRTDSGGFSYNEMWKARPPNKPLLLVYLIDKDSIVGSSESAGRSSLFDEESDRIHVVGLALAIPSDLRAGESENEVREYFIRKDSEPFPEEVSS